MRRSNAAAVPRPQLLAPTLRSSTLPRGRAVGARRGRPGASGRLIRRRRRFRPPDARNTVSPVSCQRSGVFTDGWLRLRDNASHCAPALAQAAESHDSRAISLAHYELASTIAVGDVAIVRELFKAASALHAAGDRRHLALVHSLSGISRAARALRGHGPLRQAERLAFRPTMLATVCGNQANVLMLGTATNRRSRWRSKPSHEAHGSSHGRGRPGDAQPDLRPRRSRARRTRCRALDVRSHIQFHETTGAVFDTLAQIH